MADSNLGFWLFAGRNGLEGASSTRETLPDGRVMLVKDPTYPAVLEDFFIIQIIRTVPQARSDFNRLFPDLDVVSQDRLTTLIENNPRVSSIIRDEQAFYDMVQHRNVTSGVRTRLARALR